MPCWTGRPIRRLHAGGEGGAGEIPRRARAAGERAGACAGRTRPPASWRRCPRQGGLPSANGWRIFCPGAAMGRAGACRRFGHAGGDAGRLASDAAAHAQRMLVHFQIHAPGAQRVELVGDFNNWTPGAIRLHGPDASGHWTADVELPEGRYEYQFLVNGKTWVTDPNAATHRPDGFGRENAVMDVYEERS